MHRLASRLLLSVVSLCALGWALDAFPRDIGLATERQISRRVAEGYTLDPDVVARAASRVAAAGSDCRGDTTRMTAYLEVKRAEDALRAQATSNLKEAFDRLGQALDRRLSCAPTDGFAWFSLFWLRLATGGFTPADEKLLAMSYQTAPEEVWVARRRNLVAGALLPLLGPDIRPAFNRELIALLMARQYDVVGRVLAFLDAGSRDALQDDLRQIDHRTLQYLDHFMAASDLPVVPLPGIEPFTGKPAWIR